MEELYKLHKLHKIEIITSVFFLIVFLSAHFFGWSDGTTNVFENAVMQNKESVFVLPLLYWVGTASYLLLGPFTFMITPFVFLSLALFFLFKMFSHFQLKKEAILLCFVSTSKWIPLLNFFNRDCVLFSFSCIFTYHFFKYVKEGNTHSLYYQILMVILMGFTKIFWLYFFIIFLIGVAYKHKEKLNFLPAMFFDMPKYVNSHIQGFNQTFPTTSVLQVFSGFANPMFGMSFLLFLKKRDFIHLTIMFTTFIVWGVIMANGFSTSETVRYTIAIIPLHLFYIGDSLKQVKGEAWAKVLLIFLLAKLGSGFFYLDAQWKLLLRLMRVEQ